MAEAGGASTQAGIYYQNSVAALALADLLELGPLPPRDRVVEVRVEAPTDVDDIVIRYADGHQQFLNVKTSTTLGSEAWNRLWSSLKTQMLRPDFGADDQLAIVMEEQSQLARSLRDMCDRASSSTDKGEWCKRLAQPQAKILANIVGLLGPQVDALELMRRTTVKILPADQIEAEFARRRLGGGFVLPATLLTLLRDVAGGGGRKRALFLAAPLRRRLLSDYDVDLAEPLEWGLPAYRLTVSRLARLEIPGTGISGSTEELFVWPRARPYDRTRPSDFEDEQSIELLSSEVSAFDLSTFPSDQLDRCVIVAGPGYGKSALLTAIAGKLAKGPYVPIMVPLASFAVGQAGVIEFLATSTNRELDIKPDWQRLAEQGLLLLLFDGLDEISAGVRPAVLKRIATFSARYPLAPWMLTVRDPAVLSGLPEAQVIELLPLEDDDIERFVSAMGRRLVGLDGWAFVNRLKTHPDLDRLARIPLFLSMLLAAVDITGAAPATRSDLIEKYLKTLFAPHEHKVVSGLHDKAAMLRDIAEALAFDRLENQEIGASEREVRNAILRVVEDASQIEPLFDQLQANGILRRQSAIRLQFPFPIVQEYLAACHLVRHFAEVLASRIEDAVQRPWAQVLQFALELHPEPTPVIRSMLDRSDDAFCTGLRLVGRCIANGARVTPELRGEVGDKLVAFWTGAPTRARERVGRLIGDGFANPIAPALKEALHHRWLLSSGAGDIISEANDQELTLSVLHGLMEERLERFMTYHSLKPAISAAGDRAFASIIERADRKGLSEDEFDGLGDLLGHFASGSVSRKLALTAANNPELSIYMRLVAFRVAGAPLDISSMPLIYDALLSDGGGRHWAVSRAIELHPDRATVLRGFFRDDRLPFERKYELVGDIVQMFPDAGERADFINACKDDPTLDSRLRDVVRLFAARFGDRATFEELVEAIPVKSIEVVGQTISLFGHHPGRELAERAAHLVEARVNSGADASSLAHSVTTGMLYIYEMDYGLGGTLHHTQPHAGVQRWMEAVETWSARDDLSEIQRLRLLTAGAQLGSKVARVQLEATVLALSNPDDSRYDQEDDYRHVITSAIREARRRRPLLPLQLAERFVRAKRPNLPQTGISAIEAYESLDAMKLLISLHSELSDWYVNDALANAIEGLAAKLGLVVCKANGKFSV